MFGLRQEHIQASVKTYENQKFWKYKHFTKWSSIIILVSTILGRCLRYNI